MQKHLGPRIPEKGRQNEHLANIQQSAVSAYFPVTKAME
jgi:hypothetical protein